MASKDWWTYSGVFPALHTQTIASNTTTTGVTVDTQFFESVTFTFQAGTLADGVFTPNIQDSLDGSTNWTNVPDSNSASPSDQYFVIGNYSAVSATYPGTPAQLTASNQVSQLGYVGKNRYVRCQIISTGVTSGGPISATCSNGYAHYASNQQE